MCGVVWCYTGDAGAGRRSCSSRRANVGTPALDGVRPMPLPGVCRRAFDALYPPGAAVVLARPTSSTRSPTRRSTSTSSTARSCRRGHRPCTSTRSTAPPPRRARTRHAVGLPRRQLGRQVIAGVDPDPANAERSSRMDDGLLGGAAPVLGGRRLRELHDGRGPGAGQSHLPRQLRPARRGQANATTRTTSSTSTRTSSRRRRSERRGVLERPAAQRSSSQVIPLHSEPVAVVAAHEHEQHATRRRGSGSPVPARRESTRLGERADVAAAVAAAARAGHLEREDLAQHSRGAVSVQFLHLHLPVGPNRSVRTRSGAWPSSTSSDATLSTNGVGPQTKIARLFLRRQTGLAQQVGVDAPRGRRPRCSRVSVRRRRRRAHRARSR